MHCSEGENKMKQFLYLDTDIVNSIIAQSEKGLIQEQSEENGSDKKKGTHISGSMEGSGTAGGSFLKFWQLLLYRTFYQPVMRCCLRKLLQSYFKLMKNTFYKTIKESHIIMRK